MKTSYYTLLCLTVLGLTSTLGGQPAPPAPATPPGAVAPGPMPPGEFSSRLRNLINQAGTPATAEPGLTRFNLDFPGGTPAQLVAALEKALERPLNAIIPDEFADTKLPPLKMNSVDVAQLFQALAAASRKSEAVMSSSFGYGAPMNYQVANTSCGFRAASEGKLSDDTIWYFYVDKPVLPPVHSSAKACRFYALAPYLEHGLTVDDITTAIEAGWKMLGDTSPPDISFHKDTKLLIAVGDPTKLETIDAALKALEPSKSAPRPLAPPPATPPEKPKAEKK